MTKNITKAAREYIPRIGVSGVNTVSKFYAASVAVMMAQIRAAGAEPVYIGDHKERIERSGGNVSETVTRDLEKLDGIVIMGNNMDIDPAKYGQKKHYKTDIETNLERASYEEEAIRQALAHKIPLLGVCGGMQRINVLDHDKHGGTLNQHLKRRRHSQGDIPPFVPVQLIKIEEGSRLAEIADGTDSLYTPTHEGVPGGVIMENSFHHQAVEKVRDDFQVCARSDDGVIEAIEPKRDSKKYSDQYVMAVQWHPEFGASDLGPKIIGSVVGAAREYAVRHERKAPVIKDFHSSGKMGWEAIVARKDELLKYQHDRTLGRY